MAETMKTGIPPILAAALEYARQGVPVFPCTIDKKPLTADGFKAASTEERTIRVWWETHPAAIIGIPTGAASGWAVLDLDHKPNKFGVPRNGTKALNEITGGEVIPDTVEITTPTGGRHIYFRNQPDFKCSTDDKLGIDVRAEGGYVCVPPSPGYMYSNPPGLFPVADVPDFLLDIMRNGTRKRVHDDHNQNAAPAVKPSTAESDDSNPDDVRQVLFELWDADDYHDWMTAALALHTVQGGFDIFLDWAKQSPKFNHAENVRQWNISTPSRGITARSILARAPRDRLSELARSRAPSTPAPVFSIFSGGKDAGAGPGTIATAADRFAWITRETGATPVLTANWLIKRVLPAEGLGVIFGRPGSGKTFTVLDMAMHVAGGLPWRGLKVRPSAVSYVSPEAGRVGVNRVIGWCRHNGQEWPAGFRLSPVSVNLCSSADDANALIADIKANQPACRLVVVDTLNRAMAGGDENSGEDMGRFVALCDLIAKEVGCFVLVVHHSGKDAAKGSRGHSSLLGAVSLELEVTKEQGQPGTVRVTKMRDGEDGGEYGFEIESVPLGVDEDGEEVTTGVSIVADAAAVQTVRDAQPKGKNQKLVAGAFDQFVDDYGRPNPAGTGYAEPGRVMVVDGDRFVDFAAGKLVGGKPHEKRKTVREAIDGLVAKGYFAINGSMIWRV